jgi:hypothetical protein
MITGILTFLQMLPRLFTLMEQLGRVMADKRFHAWLDDLEKTVDRIEKAQTPKEKQDAAQALAQSIRNSR